MNKAVIFDMDGTLFQTEKILELALEDAFQDLRLKGEWNKGTPIEEYRDIMGVPLPEVWATLLPNHDEKTREEVDRYFLDRLTANISEGRGSLYPEVKKALRSLKEQGYSIYIASNGLTKYLQAIVNFYRLDEWVTETFSIEQIDSLDKADLVKGIVEKYEIQEGFVVGDRLSDIKAAKRNELTAVGCRFDFAKEEELAQADYVISALSELLSITTEREKVLAHKEGE
ncbi:HAD hydrolase-like protein [Halobacillus litoralis]|uniref:HAD family hydrolase n=1 Tax=Halobacillus litoralis TaxID=45668 RepID=UPI001CD35356|nr:HAD hydrolase-like protein [Halobacillus litoralis]MCA0969237.1 HAD hydrolase-like protein [Halobacillus litoralis]